MSKEKVGAADQMAVAVAGPVRDDKPNAVGVWGEQDFECWETGPDGIPRRVWAARAKNGVVSEGYQHMGNVFLGTLRATTQASFLVPHTATYHSTRGWGQLSGSVVNGWSGNASASFNPVTFASNAATTGQWTATTQYTFSAAGTSTVNGMAMIMYTSASCATNPANSSDIKVYNIGTFTAGQAVQSNNTLSVTISLNISSS